MGKKKFDQHVEENKNFIVFYLVWFLLQLVLLLVYLDTGNTKDFWPFENFDIRVYDYTEFIFYLIAPIIIFLIWKVLSKKNSSNRKK